MDDPEDLLQLVLGMASPSFYNELFSKGIEIPKNLLMAGLTEELKLLEEKAQFKP